MIPPIFSKYTITGLIITIAGILVGFYFYDDLGFSLSLIGLLLIVFNFYLRSSSKNPNISQIPSKILTLFWAAVLLVNYLIYYLYYALLILGFSLALVLRIINIILRKLEVKNEIKTKYIPLIPIIAVSIITILCTFIYPIAYLLDPQDNIIELNWMIGKIFGLMLNILIYCMWYFPILTCINVSLNANRISKIRNKFITSGIKIMVPSLVLLVFYFINEIASFLLRPYIQLGGYLMLIAGIILIISAFIFKPVLKESDKET